MVKYIFHISDIHIKIDNATNIKNSFINLVKDIVEAGVNNSLLVIAGDIFENKTFFTSDEIYIFRWMMKGLIEKKIRTIIIPGNHDYNINSTYLENNVEVLTDEYPNITCLSNTQVYNISNIDFYVFSPIDKEIPALQHNSNIKIALLHEAVTGAVYDNGERITGDRFSVDDFKQFDYVMLGDIHKPQFLTPRAAYCGSFVQKNKGEGLNHGYILWDLDARAGQHVFIPLKEVFLKIEARDDDCILPQLTPDQTVKYISLLHTNCSDAYVTKVREIIKKSFGFINNVVNRDNYSYKLVTDVNETADGKDIDLENSAEISLALHQNSREIDQIELIKTFLSNEKPEFVARIIDYHNKKLQNRKEVTYTRYKLNYLYWSNILCYGKGNYIDFRDFKQNIVLLNGKNKQGKSSVIDILIRILFNESPRGYKDDIVNKLKQSGEIKLEFSIGPDIYVIEQTMAPKRKISQHRLFKNGENITKCTINETYRYLKQDVGIGNYEDFLNMTTALQNRQFLVDIEKKKLLSLLTKILNMDVLHDLEKETRSEISFLKRLNKLKIQDYEKIVDEIKDYSSEKLKEKKHIIDTKIENIEAKIQKINDKLQSLNNEFVSAQIPADLEAKISIQKTALNRFVPDKALRKSNAKKLKSMVIRAEILREKIVDMGVKYTEETPPSAEEYAEARKQIEILKAMVSPVKLTASDKTESAALLESDICSYLQTHEATDLEHLYKKRKDSIETEPIKPDFYDNYKKYKDILEVPLPDYRAVKTNKNILAQNISEFNENFGILQYGEGCPCCINNKANIYKIYDVERNTAELKKMEAILAMREATVSEYQNAKHRAAMIEKYDSDVTDYEIFKQIQSAKAQNKKVKKYNRILNIKRYMALQDLVRRCSIYEHHKTQNDRAELSDLENDTGAIRRYLEQCDAHDSYASNIELLKVHTANQAILSQISVLKDNLKRGEAARKDSLKEQMIVAQQIGFIDIKIAQKDKLIAEQQETADQLSFLEVYYNCVNHKTGIPTIMVKNLCNLLNSLCNYVLHRICDFELDIQYDKEFKFYTKENDIIIPATMGSGYQKFVIDMIMRLTLTRISVLSSPNLIFIDEGFGSLDRENFILVANILTKLKNNFDAIIIITHLDELKAYANVSMCITKHKDSSRLRHGNLDADEKKLKLVAETQSSSDKVAEYKEEQKAFDKNLEELLIIKDVAEFTCLACNKKLKLRKDSVKKHLESKSLLTKHINKAKKLSA